jgi:threonine/homoserine/homoserine lactone efflux protein
VVGLIYHFSNGITFGVMYMAIIGDATRRSWWWGVALAVGLELAMLFTPYTSFFGISPVMRFVIVTLSAHLIFGVTLGQWAHRQSARSLAHAGFAV